MEFGRRMAAERELDKGVTVRSSNAVFDETGNFVVYATMLGIKVGRQPSWLAGRDSHRGLMECCHRL